MIKRFDTSTLFAAAMAVAMALPVSVQAAPYYWDGTDSSANADGGNGPWDTSTLNWDTASSAGAATNWINANNDTAVFAGTAGTVSLSTGITVGGMQFDIAGYIIQSNTLTFGTSGNIVANQDATINSAIGAATGTNITKTGSGILTLGGNNTYVGNTTISLGTLKAGSATALSANSAYSVAAGAILDLGGFTNTIKSLSTATGTITNSGSAANLTITSVGSGANQLFTGNLSLTLSTDTALTNASSTYSGGTTLVSGRPFLPFNTTVGAGTPGALSGGIYGKGAITIGANATSSSQLYIRSATLLQYDIVVNSAYGLGATEPGALRIEGGGIVLAGAINANLADATFFTGNAALQAVSVTGAISGSSGVKLFVTPNGVNGLTVTLNNSGTANSYSGNTTIATSNSVLTLGRADQIPNGAGKGNLIVTLGTFNMGGFSETINGLSGNGAVDGVSGSPTLTVGDNNATGVSNTFSGVIKGPLTLTKTGTGTLTLANTNTYSGATVISNGTLKLGGTPVSVADGSFESPVITLNNASHPPAVLTWWPIRNNIGITSGNYTLYNPTGTEPDGVQAAFTKGATGASSWLGQSNIAFSASSTYRISFSAVCRGDPNYVTPLAVMLDSTVVGTVSPGYTAWTNFSLWCDVSAGAHSLIFSNTLTGDKTVCIDNVKVMDITPSGSYNVPSNSPISIAAGATFDLAGVSQPVVSLSDSGSAGGSVTNSDSRVSTLTLNGGGTTFFSGGVKGRIGLVKAGSGTQTLSGTNTYSGGTSVSNGTLLVNGSVTGAVTVAGGTLGGAGVVAGVVTNFGTITAGADAATPGTLTVSNLVMGANSSYNWKYNATTNDGIVVSGTLSLPTVATVNVSQVISGKMPSSGVLFTFGAVSPASPNLQSWVITGATPSTGLQVVGNQVKLITPTGWLMFVQ
jgi:autotransporter-associated beta strand protein